MPFSVDEFQDLVRLLEQRPEWRAELRRLVLSEELLELPAVVRQLAVRTDQLADRVDQLAVRMDQLVERLGELAAAQARTERNLATLTARVDQLAGDFRGFRLEWRYRERASAYFGPLLRGLRVYAPSVVVDEYEDRLPRDAVSDLLRADLVVQGQPRRAPERGQVWLVVEVSATVDSHDLERALRRARTLRQAGLKVLPAVAGDHVTQAVLERTREERAVLLQDVRVAGWEEALDAWAA